MHGITKEFPGGRVLHGVQLTVEAGEVHALVGQNGAGKSTLIKILGGVYPDYGGVVRISGREVRLSAPQTAIRAGISVIYQELDLVPHMTVAENIALGREPGRRVGPVMTYSYSETRRWSEGILERLGVDLPLDAPVDELSVALQQITQVVRAVALDARVLVMDEPTARLSMSERDRLFSTVRQLQTKGTGIIFISHFLEEVFQIATRVTVLRNGRVVHAGLTSDLDPGTLAQLMVGRAVEAGGRPQAHPPGPRQELLRVEGLGYPYRFRDLSFRLNAGEIVGMAGLVGSGRTSVARALVAADGPPQGRIWIQGRPVRFGSPKAAARRGVVILPEDRKRQGLVLVRPVSENIVLTALANLLTCFGMVRQRARQQMVTRFIDDMRIVASSPEVSAALLSGGNQQKVLLARLLASEAGILILDQPTAGVDIGTKAQIYGDIARLAGAGCGVLIISDDLDEIIRLSHRVLVMRRGDKVAEVEGNAVTRGRLLQLIVGQVG